MINLLKYSLLYLLVWSGQLASAFQKDDGKNLIYASSIGWHTGIIIPAQSLPDSIWSEDHNYSDAAFLEIGWGEADYYPDEGFNLWYAIKSVFWPTSSVVHINPIDMQVEDYYYNTGVVRMEINSEQLEDLSSFLLESLELDENGKIIPVAEGKNIDSYFYESSQKYYFPKNSNVWAAKAIKSAGFSISPIWYQTTGCLLNKAEDFGEPVEED